MSYFQEHKTTLVYLVIGQIGWFACVLGAARGIPSVGIAVVALFLVWHCAHARRPRAEAKLIATVCLLGATWDSALVITGLMGYPNDGPALHHAPYWIVALWALFAAQVNVAYGWLKHRLALSALFGAVAGPASFRAGAGLHAVRLEHGWWTMLVLAAGWSLLLPLVILLSRRWDGIGPSMQTRP